jgi:RNase_H superfamily
MAIPMKFLAFDIETAKEVPGADFNWKPHRPLGISCIASLATGDEQPRVWFSKLDDGTPAPQMTQGDVAAFVNHLQQSLGDGIVPLTWNGLGFDLDVLSEESAMPAECSQIAKSHVDMMFHVVCEKGFPVSLANAAAGSNLPGKTEGVKGCDAPALWQQGQFETVKQYVAQDVRVTMSIAEASLSKKSFAWKTRKGSTSRMPLSNGWLTVEQALQLPLPDTSWMSTPLQRESFMSWMS